MQSKKISNFHTHTCLCKHAEGIPLDYISVAAAQGCSVLGFSDHCPYPDDGRNTWHGVRMEECQVEDYVADVRSAAENAPFPVFCGFECEYDKRYTFWYRELKENFGIDYLVFGHHWVDVCGEYVYAPQLESPKDIQRYFDWFLEGICSNLFNFIAHPDLIMANGRAWTKELEKHFCEVIDAAIEANLPLEINGEGISRPLVAEGQDFRHPYPVDRFWQLAVDKGAKVICNADAHRPDVVIANATKTREYAKKFGIVPIETIF